MVPTYLTPFKACLVIGPTASGKTALAHALSDALAAEGSSCELVNLDAFQFYRGVDAGTAKPDAGDRARYLYHGIDILEPDERFDAQAYATFAHGACAGIWSRGRLPVCVGGSGLYLRAFLHGLDALPGRDDAVRSFLRACASAWGWTELHRWLAALDPVRASEVHPNDKARVERAVELCLLGAPPSQARTRARTLRPQDQGCLFDSFVIHVDLPDARLRERISRRLPEMVASGWRAEVENLEARFGGGVVNLQAMQAIGYPEMLEAVRARRRGAESDSGTDQPSADAGADWLSLVATRTWQYVRRQRTWNAKEKCDARFSFEPDVDMGNMSFESLVLALRQFFRP